MTSRTIVSSAVLSSLLFLVLFFSSTGAAQSENLTASERAWLAEKKEIVFVSQTLYPPFEFVNDEDDHVGMCIELVRWIATEYGFKARFRDMSFKKAQEAVLNGEADVLTSLFYSEKRDETFDFTRKTWDVPALIFVQSERPDITELKDLEGKKIAMQRGDYAAEFLTSSGVDYKLVPTASFSEAVDMVVAGNADAVIGDKQIVLYHLFSNNLTKEIKSVGEPLYTGQNSMALHEDSRMLQTILNKGIRLAETRGIFDSISRKWSGTTYEDGDAWYIQYLSLILFAAVAFLGISGLILLWNTQLRRALHFKTAELRRSKTELKTLLNTLPDLVWLKDAKGIYLGCNRKFEQFFGALEAEIVGKSDYDFVDSALADFFRENDKAAMQAGGPTVNEEEITYASDGHKELLETIKTPLYADDGTLIGVLGIARDITGRKQMESRLVEQERNFRSFFNTMDELFFVLDEKGMILHCNEMVLQRLGYSYKELQGKSVLFLHPEKWREEAGKIVAAMLAGKKESCPIPLVDKDGREIAVETRIVKGKWSGQDVVFGVSKDISDLKASEEKFSMAFHASPSLMAITDPATGLFVDVNQAFLDKLGYKRHEVIGHDSVELKLVLRTEKRQEALDLIAEQGYLRDFELEIRSKTGDIRYGIFSAEMIELKHQTLMLSVMNDITERKQAEEKMAHAKQRAEAADKAKSVFLANMSHELRTPLNAILGYAQLFSQDQTLSQKQREGVQIVHRAGEHLLQIINEILDLSKIEAEKMELMPGRYHLHEFLQDTEEIIRYKAEQKGLAFHLELGESLPVYIETDAFRLRQILLNLLSNAVKFTEKGHCILRVTATSTDSDAARLTFEVDDSGPGIDPAEKDKIFEPFCQAGMRQHYSKGTGLGLTISHKLVRLMGGELQLISPLNKEANEGRGEGSRFSFSIDVPVFHELEMVLEAKKSAGGFVLEENHEQAKRILLVDDDELGRTSLRDTLEAHGFLIDEVNDGSQVVTACEQCMPDLIVMDLSMPNMDGYEATQSIREHEKCGSIPIIALTASIMQGEELNKRCFECGFNDYISKPYSIEKLIASIATQLDLNLELADKEPLGAIDKIDTMIAPPEEILDAVARQLESCNIEGVIEKATVLEKEESGRYKAVAERIKDLADELRLVELDEFIAALREKKNGNS